MTKADTGEAVPILTRTLQALLGTVPNQGRPGAELRRVVGDLLSHAETLLHDDQAAAPMRRAFDLARQAGTTLASFGDVRELTTAETPLTTGGKQTKDALIRFCLAQEARSIADTKFASRNQANQVRAEINDAFAVAEEVATDNMDATTYRVMVELHAAVMFHLTETARPLPRLVRFQFAGPLPTIKAAHRLYDDASRCDELREENRVVHPAFMLPTGVALSA
jgi:hypothetical protein